MDNCSLVIAVTLSKSLCFFPVARQVIFGRYRIKRCLNFVSTVMDSSDSSSPRKITFSKQTHTIYNMQFFTHSVSFPIKFRPPKIFGSKNLAFGVLFRGLEVYIDKPIISDFGSESEMPLPSEECFVLFGKNFHFFTNASIC